MSAMTTTAEAERAIDELTALIEKLTGLVEQETALIHAGKIRSAATLERAKAELASQLYVSGERFKAHVKFLRRTAPERCVALARVQDAFRTILKKNMVVLATAHAVSEGIMRRLSGDLARKAAPQVYGATGRTTAPNPKYGRPLAISRSL
jgi:flagellar biosynthesis/type III secretory pathway chaperone